MSPVYLFLATALTAMTIENPAFARALGLGRDTMFMKSPKSGILLGGTLTWMVVLSSLFAAMFNVVLIDVAYAGLTRPLAYLASVALVYAFTVKILLERIDMPTYKQRFVEVMPLATFNTALFGAFYISVTQNFDVFQTIGYALGTGAGYTAAILIIYFARQRLSVSPAPRSFRGLPVLLVYLGLISLALYGLIGRVLPT